MNGGGDTATTLASSILATLSKKGVSMSLRYSSPLIAGGGITTAEGYASLLRAIIRKDNPLVMNYFLKKSSDDPNASCTSPTDPTCLDGTGKPFSLYSPAAPLNWHYSTGHWIEDDPLYGDGTYSSLGAFGFYPWIDASKTYYGLISTKTINARTSQSCGTAIRKSFMTGVAQN
jgi:hypothetical protein